MPIDDVVLQRIGIDDTRGADSRQPSRHQRIQRVDAAKIRTLDTWHRGRVEDRLHGIARRRSDGVRGQTEDAAGAIEAGVVPVGEPVRAADLERMVAAQHRQRVVDRRDVMAPRDRCGVLHHRREIEWQVEAQELAVQRTVWRIEFDAAVRRRVAAVLHAVPELVEGFRSHRPIEAGGCDPPRLVKHELGRDVGKRPLAAALVVLTGEIPASHPRQRRRDLEIEASGGVRKDLLARLEPGEALRAQIVRADQLTVGVRLGLLGEQRRDTWIE